MQIIDKNQLNDKLGKFGMWSGKVGDSIIGEVKYLGGIPDLDELIEIGQINLKVINLVSFDMRPKGVEVFLLTGFTTKKISIGLLD